MNGKSKEEVRYTKKKVVSIYNGWTSPYVSYDKMERRTWSKTENLNENLYIEYVPVSCVHERIRFFVAFYYYCCCY